MIQIQKPICVIQEDILKRNITRMKSKADRLGLQFRPHFKTHQSAEIAQYFKSIGVEKCTVSSVSMAKYFAEHGWKNITIAVPVNLLEITEIKMLCKKINLNIIIDNENSLTILSKELKENCSVFIKINCGYNRAGILAEDIDRIVEFTKSILKVQNLNFKGILTHDGNSYGCKTKEEIESLRALSNKKLSLIKDAIIDFAPQTTISIGDTPTSVLSKNFENIDEIRPGNFVFFDLMQRYNNICKIEDIAISIACPIVGIYPEREEIVIYGGGVHLSKEFLVMENGEKNFGEIVRYNSNYKQEILEKAYLRSLSQEHGIIKMPKENFGKLKTGDIIGVLPIHSCMSVNLIREIIIV